MSQVAFVQVSLSSGSQQVVIQTQSPDATYTSTVSTSYTAASDASSSATCAWAATTTVAKAPY